MNIQFAKLDPTHNMTLLVESPVPRNAQPAVAATLMAYEHLYAEQTGFIEAPSPGSRAHLHMMCGEFCGNAAISLALLCAMDDDAPLGVAYPVPLDISSAPALTTCMVTRETACSGWVSLEMPPVRRVFTTTLFLPVSDTAPSGQQGRDKSRLSTFNQRFPMGKREKGEKTEESIEAGVVVFDGITHIVIPVDGPLHPFWTTRAETSIRAWAAALTAPALGVLLLQSGGADREKDGFGSSPRDGPGRRDDDTEESVRIIPLVYVPAAESLVWEQGCGSGTAAIGAWLAWQRRQPVDVWVAQPGGRIRVGASGNDRGAGVVRITGHVRLVARGTAYID